VEAHPNRALVTTTEQHPCRRRGLRAALGERVAKPLILLRLSPPPRTGVARAAARPSPGAGNAYFVGK